MNVAGSARAFGARLGWRTYAILAAILLAVGAQDVVSGSLVGLLLAAVALGIAGGLRAGAGRTGGLLALVPLALALAYLALAASVSLVAELLVGLSSLLMLSWLADGADATPGSLRRAADLIVLPSLGLVIAIGGAYLLPAGPLDLGIASILLILAVLIVVVSLARWVYGEPTRPASL